MESDGRYDGGWNLEISPEKVNTLLDRSRRKDDASRPFFFHMSRTAPILIAISVLSRMIRFPARFPPASSTRLIAAPGFGNRWQHILLVVLLFSLCAAIYLPGIAGPWIFDDYSNLLENSYVRIQSLDAQSLRSAAFSLESGPFKRPIPMLSFALNYYAAGSFSSSAPFKSVNLALHVANALLVFAFLSLLLRRARALQASGATNHVPWFAALGALLWLVHPIQMTSVLYVVQRMTEMSALFTLAALVSYLVGRQLLASGKRQGLWLLLLGPVLFGFLGLLSKENAALLPFFILCIEYTLFADEAPWRSFKKFPNWMRRFLLLAAAATAVSLLVFVVMYSLPQYSIRPFSLTERLMTEARVLFFYLSLIAIPQINQFGHMHDDIEISRSLLDPWTTLPALIGIGLLIWVALWNRRRHPLLSFGILWFFTAHLMESTVLALEIAHEHRNYVALVGPVIVLLYLIGWALKHANHRIVWAVVTLFVLFISTVTLQRATQWADYNSFFRYEVEHHPASARTQAGFSIVLQAQGRYEEAIKALRRAAEIESFDPGFLMQVHILAARRGEVLGADDQHETLRRLREGPITAVTHLALAQAGECILKRCKVLSRYMEEWLDTLLNHQYPALDISFLHHLRGYTMLAQGRIDEAKQAFRLSHSLDPAYLHPLFALADVELDLGNTAGAKQLLDELRVANERTPYPRNQELLERIKRMQQLEKNQRGADARRQ